MLDLATMRKNAKLSQEDLAQRVNMTQSQISRLESTNLAEVPLGQLLSLGRALGVEPSSLFSMIAAEEPTQSPAADKFDPGKPFESLWRNLRLLTAYFESAPAIEHATESQGAPSTSLSSLTRLLGRKPYAVLTGCFDSGKSRCANNLLGANVLPARYTPATRLRTIVRHIDDRPIWLREEVWIFDGGFDPERMNDENHCLRHKLVAGSVEALDHYGLHGGKYADLAEAQTAVVYVDAKILEAVTIVDLPGFDNDECDSAKADASRRLMDILIYLSPAKGFLRATDHAHLANALRYLPAPEDSSPAFPTLSNLFIVASHASQDMTDADLKYILDRGAERLHRHLQGVLDERASRSGRSIDAATLRSRLFTFWVETPSRRRPFESGLHQLLAKSWPQHQLEKSDITIAAFKKEARRYYEDRVEAYERVVGNLAEVEATLAEVRAAEPMRKEKALAATTNILATAARCKRKSERDVERIYEAIVNIDAVESLIDANYEKSSDAKEYGMGLVIETIQTRISRGLTLQSVEFADEVRKFQQEYPIATANLPTSKLGHPLNIPFDTTAAFVSGLAGLAALGGLGVWAAALGNLGQYILVARLATILAAIGIPTGGTAATIAAVAAIGGPAILAMTFLCFGSMGLYSLFGDGWKKRLAKKIIKTFIEQSVEQKFQEAVAKYWDDAATGVKKGVEGIEISYAAHLSQLEDIVSADGGRERIEARLANYGMLRDFFAGIPWRVLAQVPDKGNKIIVTTNKDPI